MGTFPTGVTVVAARDPAGAPVGLTVNAFTSVSLEPPLVLVCIDRSASSHDVLLQAGAFAVSILSSGQEALARRFAVDPSAERFAGVDWHEGPAGAPVLDGAAGWLACTVESVHSGGDHTIVVGRVHDGAGGGGAALVFHRGGFGSTAP